MLLSWGHFRFCGVKQSFLGKVFSSLCHINSPWDLRLHPVQSSCFAEEEPEGQRGKVARLSVAGQGHAGPLAPRPHRSQPLSGVVATGHLTPPLPVTGAPKGPVTRVLPLAASGVERWQSSWPSLGQDQAPCRKQDWSEWPRWGAKPITSEKPAS